MEREKMKKEALKRLNILGLVSEVTEDFENEGLLYYSDASPSFGGILIPLDKQPVWLEKVRQVEEEYDILVYHATHEKTEFGDLLTLFYVSHHQEEWENDKTDLSNKDSDSMFIFTAYVINLTYPELSEFGSVAMKKLYSGLVRVG